MRDYQEFSVTNNLNKNVLFEMGFRRYGADYYVLTKFYYSNMIKIKIYIDVNNRKLTYDVENGNTGWYYYPFYQDDTENNLVVKTLINELDKTIDLLVTKKILYKKTSINN